MTTTIDNKRRATIRIFEPGDVAQVEVQGPDVVILRRMKPVESPKPKVAKRNGRLVVVSGPRLTDEDVRRAIEDEA